MGYFLSILFFVAVFPLLGWGFLRLIRFNSGSGFCLEKYFIFLGLGLGIFPLLNILFSFVYIPLLWWLFALLGLVISFLYLNQGIKIPNILKLSRSFLANYHFLIMLIIFFIVFFVMVKGAFVYPYLEDDDSWAHALSAKYVAVEKNLRPDYGVLHYLNPYPPAYAVLMGVLHQTNDSIYWTLKFFNALIVALTIPFFYLFAGLFFKNKNKALFSTFVLASLPSFLSHFIWAHSLVILFMLIVFYWMFYLREAQISLFKSVPVLSVLVAAVFFTQVTQAIKLGILFFALFMISLFLRRKIDWQLFLSGFFGLVLSLLWWGSKAFGVLTKHQASAVAKNKGSIFASNIGSASRAYSLSEFLLPPYQGLMTNPIGIGWVVCILAIIGFLAIILMLIFRHKRLDIAKKEALWWILFFAVFAFLGVNSVTFNLPVGLFAFRFWMLLAIPVALLSSFGLWAIFWFFRRLSLSKIIPVILLIFLISIVATSASSKYSINTAFWPPGIFWGSYDEIGAFTSLRESSNLKIFPACKEGFKKLIGNDQYACAWCKDELEFQKTFFNHSAPETVSFLKSKNYKSLVLDSSCLNSFSEEDINLKINELLSLGYAIPNQELKGLFVLDLK